MQAFTVWHFLAQFFSPDWQIWISYSCTHQKKMNKTFWKNSPLLRPINDCHQLCLRSSLMLILWQCFKVVSRTPSFLFRTWSEIYGNLGNAETTIFRIWLSVIIIYMGLAQSKRRLTLDSASNRQRLSTWSRNVSCAAIMWSKSLASATCFLRSAQQHSKTLHQTGDSINVNKVVQCVCLR